MLSRFSPFSGNLVKEALQNPENEASVRSLFNSLDSKKNGFLDEDELRKFTDGLLKVNTKLTSLNLDIEILNRRILRFADHNDTGHLSYSDFHALIQNNEYLEEALKNVTDFKPVLNILQSNANYASIKVSLLEKANSWTVSKTVQVNIDRTAPLRQFSVAIHSALLPNEVPQDYIYYMNNIDTPLNSALALNDFRFSVDGDKSDTLHIISISAFKKVNLNTELSIFKLRKPPPNSYSFNESINFKNSKFQSKFSKGTFILNECIMYLFSPNAKNQEVLTKIFVLDNCKLFEEDDHSMCIRY
jgi:hypothetical protein